MKFYHNPRCSKSREVLALLAEQHVEVVEYLKTPLSVEELTVLIKKLGIVPIDLIRKGEPEYKENYKGKTLSNEEWIQAMVRFPKLIERPILEKGDKAVVCRPAENVNKLL